MLLLTVSASAQTAISASPFVSIGGGTLITDPNNAFTDTYGSQVVPSLGASFGYPVTEKTFFLTHLAFAARKGERFTYPAKFSGMDGKGERVRHNRKPPTPLELRAFL